MTSWYQYNFFTRNPIVYHHLPPSLYGGAFCGGRVGRGKGGKYVGSASLTDSNMHAIPQTKIRERYQRNLHRKLQIFTYRCKAQISFYLWSRFRQDKKANSWRGGRGAGQILTSARSYAPQAEKIPGSIPVVGHCSFRALKTVLT